MLSITRKFDAPRDLVFGAFIDPQQALQWLGPHGFTMTHFEADVRPGGAWRGCMRATDDGRELWHGGVYREVVPVERLSFTFAFDTPGAPETLVTITLEDHGGQTLMRFRQSLFETPEICERYRAGWAQEFEQLEKLLRRRC